ncbi:unnamed protein product [Prorocentrum cordatum]|uniref:Glycosyltransferase family 92 protein n=1 Tax=Prorocentrum cordatum TaxID=2364126 RepID=A0ABN9UM86_9DINO|nr:unnamed protein product [Polarella glacialis]
MGCIPSDATYFTFFSSWLWCLPTGTKKAFCVLGLFSIAIFPSRHERTCGRIFASMCSMVLLVIPMFTWQPACFSTVDWVVWPTVNHYSRSYQQMVELRNSSTFEWNHHSLESIQKRFRGANGSACKDLRILNFQPQLLQMQQARATNNARNQSFRGSKREYCVDHYVQFGMATCRRYYLVALSRAVAAEAEYIAEWLDYHLSVGFDKFIILNKDVTGGVEQILRPYMEQGSVEGSLDLS